jgi:hypothetical protein
MPLAGPLQARPFIDWFRARSASWNGNSATASDLGELDSLLQAVVPWPDWTKFALESDDVEGTASLDLRIDRARIDEMTQTCLPVESDLGPGTLEIDRT